MHAPLEPQGASGVGAVDGAGGEQVDERIASWRQGDCVVRDASPSHWPGSERGRRSPTTLSCSPGR